MAKSNRKLKAVPASEPLKLDFGCGKNKRPNFWGVDIQKFEGVDQVLDVRKAPWPWADGSVDEAFSSHFLEHLDWPDRVTFFNELYRVLKVGGTAQIITPDPSNDCFYGDPTHKAPMSGWYSLYLNKAWRDGNAPHAPYTCDFDFQNGIGWDNSMATRNDEFKMFAGQHYRNAAR